MSMPPVESLPWANWAEEGLRDLARMNPRCITFTAILPEGEVYTGYWHCDASDKILTAGHIQMDATMDMLKANGETLAEIVDLADDFEAWDSQFEDSGE